MEALFSIITTYLTHSINQHLHPNIKHQTESQPHSSCLKLTSQLVGISWPITSSYLMEHRARRPQAGRNPRQACRNWRSVHPHSKTSILSKLISSQNLLKERSTPLRLASREVPLLDLESQMTASPAAEAREAAPKASSLTEKSIQLRQERKVVRLHLRCSQQAAGLSMMEFGNGRV